MTKSLHTELRELRDKIKSEEKIYKGRAGVVCTDSALLNIVKAMPAELKDFESIEGLGDTFIEKYGKQFLAVINNYNKSSLMTTKADKPILNTLKELEKKLVNLNKRNRLLYSSRLTPKYGLDILTLCDAAEVIDLIFRKKRGQIKLCDLTVEDVRQAHINQVNYNRLVTLTREVNRDFREKGQYDLFIAYPFVKGKMLGEDFELNAPLVLFPVTLTKEISYFSLKYDTSRDIVYNNNILLAHYKFNKINTMLPNNVIFDNNIKDFFANLIEYYGKEKLEINLPSDYTVQPCDLPKKISRRGDLTVVCNMVIGKYSTYSSSMQKDLNDIIESGEVNDLLYDLLSGMEDIDFYSDINVNRYNTLETFKTVKEKELCYITPINSTQENVLLSADLHRELVVQGPPGTGKSQIITSLIANSVAKGKSILMVSEKKSALDVVYSRLGSLSKYALLLDDVNNKDNFYKQIAFMSNIDETRTENSNIDEVENDIDKYMNALNIIAEKMRDKSKFGVEVYKLYQITPKWDLSSTEELNKYNSIDNIISLKIKNLKFIDIKNLYYTFDNANLLNKVVEYKDITAKFPIINEFKEDISQSELARLINECDKLTQANKLLSEYGLLEKRSVKKALSKSVSQVLKTVIGNFTKEHNKDLLTNPAKYYKMLSIYEKYIESKQTYDSLSIIAREYFDEIFEISQSLSVTPIEANTIAYKFIINYFLLTFERDNRITLHNISNYNGVLDKLSNLLDNKLQLTKERLEAMFLNNMQNISSGKRNGDIKRIIESKRRWSVAKFTDKFAFELFHAIKVWLLTPEIVSEILPLKQGLFDLVIFDEASQLYVERGIPAILRAKSVIIAGDSKQLRPSNLGAGRIDIEEEDSDRLDIPDSGIAALEEESLLDVARFKYPPVMLDFHYRSKYSELIAFSNYAFYGGKLNVSPNPLPPTKPPIEVIKVRNGKWENRSNRQEAQKVVDYLRSFVKDRTNNQTIGIITFNSSQRDLILDIIDDTSRKDKAFAKAIAKEFDRKENGEDVGLFIKNIENVQGDERDLIIFSIGYAENEQGKIVKNFGWLNQRGGENRLNVAISRAKEKIIIITSILPQDLDVDNCKNRGPYILRKYLEYAYAVSNGDKETAHQILLSFVESDKSLNYASNKTFMAKNIKSELQSRGYEVEENIGIGAYTIDMGIKKDGVYVLGIEFDSSLYDMNENTRERDFHRWKYFNLRGWKIHRVWSSSYWDNSSREIAKILYKLEH